MKFQELRALQELGRAVVESAQEMKRTGLVEGTAGNVSCVDKSRSFALITPTGVPFLELVAAQLAIVDLDGNLLVANDPWLGVTVEKGRLLLPTGPGLGLTVAHNSM